MVQHFEALDISCSLRGVILLFYCLLMVLRAGKWTLLLGMIACLN